MPLISSRIEWNTVCYVHPREDPSHTKQKLAVPIFTLTLKLDRTFSSSLYSCLNLPHKKRDGKGGREPAFCAFILRHLFSLIQVGRSAPQCSVWMRKHQKENKV